MQLQLSGTDPLTQMPQPFSCRAPGSGECVVPPVSHLQQAQPRPRLLGGGHGQVVDTV